MDINSYISSGILERYCAGALAESEMREVERMAAQFPSIKKEIQAIELAIWNFNDQIFEGPHDQLKASIIHAIKINTNFNSPIIEKTIPSKPVATSLETIAETIVEPTVETKAEINSQLPVASTADEPLKNSPKNQKKRIGLGIFLVLILPIILAVVAFNLWNNWDALKQELKETKKVAAKANSALMSIDSNLKATHQQLDTLRNPDVIKFTLSGMKFAPNAKAVVYWNKNTNNILLDPILLPLEDKMHCYQLWCIANGQTQSLGTFSATNKNKQMLPMSGTTQAGVFLISLEPKNGSEIPNISQLCLMSK